MADNQLLVVRPAEGRVWNVGGPIVCKLSSEDSGGAYTILELTLDPGAGAGLHVHRREDKVFYVVEGQCTVGDAFTEQNVLEGAMAVFPRNTGHFFRNSGDTPCRVLITAVPGGLDHYFSEIDTALAAGEPDLVEEINRKYEVEFFTEPPRDAE